MSAKLILQTYSWATEHSTNSKNLLVFFSQTIQEYHKMQVYKKQVLIFNNEFSMHSSGLLTQVLKSSNSCLKWKPNVLGSKNTYHLSD